MNLDASETCDDSDADRITALRNRYLSLLEEGDFDAMTQIWTEDAAYVSGSADHVFRGSREIVDNFFKSQVARWYRDIVHVCHAADLEVKSDTASASWVVTVQARLRQNGELMVGVGKDFDEYRRENGEWRISSHRREMRCFLARELDSALAPWATGGVAPWMALAVDADRYEVLL